MIKKTSDNIYKKGRERVKYIMDKSLKVIMSVVWFGRDSTEKVDKAKGVWEKHERNFQKWVCDSELGVGDLLKEKEREKRLWDRNGEEGSFSEMGKKVLFVRYCALVLVLFCLLLVSYFVLVLHVFLFFHVSSLLVSSCLVLFFAFACVIRVLSDLFQNEGGSIYSLL